MRTATARLAPLYLLALVAPEANAQLVRGRVTDGISGEPVAAASVTLVDRRATIRFSARTDRDGSFQMNATPGRYLLQVAAGSYRTVGSKELAASATDTLNFEVRLPPLPVGLDAVNVVSRRRAVSDPSGFYRRRRRETGHFIGPGEIAAIHPNRVPDLLHGIPGLRFHPSVGGELLWVEGHGRGCIPTIYLDGGLASRGTSTDRANPGYREGNGIILDEFINPSQLGAIEVYRDGTDSPVGFRPVGEIGGGDCAVVVLWTTAGLGEE